MSGGHYDYKQFELNDLSDAVQKDKKIVFETEYIESKDKEMIIKDIEHLSKLLKEAAIRLHRLDWLLCGDDGVENYKKRLKEDLEGMT